MKAHNENLAKLIKKQGLTHQEVANRLNVDRSTVTRWISQGRIPGEKLREQAAKTLGTKLPEIWPSDSKDAINLLNLTSSLIQGLDRVLSSLMALATNCVLIQYGEDAQANIPITLLVEEIAVCIERNICVTVQVVNKDSIRNRTFADMASRKGFLQELSNLQQDLNNDQRKLLAFSGVQAVASPYSFVVLIDGGHYRLNLHNGYWDLSACGEVA
jgi:excisionase family DNA binding protein